MINNINNIQKNFSLVVAFVFSLLGIWGFFSNNIFGIFTANVYLSIIHIIIGLFGFYSYFKSFSISYNSSIGWFIVLLGILGLIPGIGDVMVNLLGINSLISIFHIIVGVVSLGLYFGFEKE